MLSGVQVRMARAALNLTSVQLATSAGINPGTVLSFENGAGVRSATIQKLEETFRQMGIKFLEDDGTGPGVRVRV